MSADPIGFDQREVEPSEPRAITATLRVTDASTSGPPLLHLEVEGDPETVTTIISAAADAVENEVLR